MLELSVISKLVATNIHNELKFKGIPSEDRLLICSGEEKVTKSGIIVPNNVEEGISKKGVIIQVGPITEGNEVYKDLLTVGTIIFYGDYAGKELNIPVPGVPSGHKLRVLSLNEVVYIMSNNN